MSNLLAYEIMQESGAIELLEHLAAGRMIVTFEPGKDVGFMEEVGGRIFRSKDGTKVRIDGLPLLYEAKLIDQFGMITSLGRELLRPTPQQSAS
jgi:hypothetical protein